MNQLLHQVRLLGELQRHLLPRDLPRPPGWRLAVHYAVGRWPGGDYYDVLDLSDGKLLLFFGDASDEGAPATALVAMVRVLLHSCPLSSGREQLPFCPLREPLLQPPHIILGHLNRVLAENSLAEQFLTAFCGTLNTLEGSLHYANAAHPVPRWWRAAGQHVEPLPDTSGVPLGMHDHTAYHHKRIEIGEGDKLVFYSDGLITAQNERGQMFGCERLDEALADAASQRAEGVKTAVLARLDGFCAGCQLQDDVTLVVLERMA